MDLAIDFLLITGFLTTLLILVILIGKKVKEFPHRILIYIFSIILLVFLSYYAYLHRIGWLFYGVYIFFDSVDVVVGPLLFIYTKAVIGSKRNGFKENYVHFIFPVVYVIFITMPVLIAWISKTQMPNYITTLEPVLLFVIVYSYGYCLYAYRMLLRFQKLVKFHYSNLENKNLNWIRYLLLGAGAVLTVDICTSIYELVMGDFDWHIGFVTVIPIVFLVLYLGYYGVSQSKILVPDFLLETIEDATSMVVPITHNSVVKYSYDTAEMEELRDQLELVMHQEKPFLEENLTLAALSGMLKVPDKKLSTLLNKHMHTSFYDYINGFRVVEVKHRLAMPDYKKYTLLAIAYDCGFNSKSSFNRIFKKHTNLSPSKYQQTLF